MSKLLTLMIAGSLSAGCATTQSANMQVGTSQSYLSIAEQRDAIRSVRVEKSVPVGSSVLGPIDAQRCHRNTNEIEPSDELVTIDLQVAAYARGADGIADLEFKKQSALTKNCWYTITGTGIMFRDRD